MKRFLYFAQLVLPIPEVRELDEQLFASLWWWRGEEVSASRGGQQSPCHKELILSFTLFGKLLHPSLGECEKSPKPMQSKLIPTVCSLGPMVRGREDPAFWVIRSHPKHISSVLHVGIDFFPSCASSLFIRTLQNLS